MLKTYVGTKIIRAEPLDEAQYMGGIADGAVNRPGYRVVYQDGYVSWSPKESFELAYRELSPGELKLFTYQDKEKPIK